MIPRCKVPDSCPKVECRGDATGICYWRHEALIGLREMGFSEDEVKHHRLARATRTKLHSLANPPESACIAYFDCMDALGHGAVLGSCFPSRSRHPSRDRRFSGPSTHRKRGDSNDQVRPRHDREERPRLPADHLHRRKHQPEVHQVPPGQQGLSLDPHLPLRRADARSHGFAHRVGMVR